MITRHYCPDWTANNAIREWVANALDDPSRFSYGFGDNDMRITSEGVELPFKALALGMTTKRDDPSSVGTHGEGLLVALAVAIREGLEVVIYNGSKEWTAAYEFDSDIGEEVLVVYESPLEGNSNLIFEIGNVTPELQEKVRHDCLYLQDDLGETLEANGSKILLGRAGKLYVGGVYVTDTKMQYSYDFAPNVLPLNRDRKSVDNWDLRWQTGILWSAASDGSTVAQMLFDSCPDVELAKHTAGFELRARCYDIYKEKYGDVPIAADTHEKEEMEEKLGYEDVVVTGNSSFTEMVKMSNYYQVLPSVQKEPEKTPTEKLDDLYNEITRCHEVEETYDMIEELISEFEDRGVSWDE